MVDTSDTYSTAQSSQILNAHSTCGKFKIIGLLGAGTFSKVKLAELNGLHYAIKLFDKTGNPNVSEEQLMQTFETELKVFEGVAHENVVSLVTWSHSEVYTKKDGS